MSIEIDRQADDPKGGMILAELVAFVEQCQEQGLSDEARLKAEVGFGLQLRAVRVKGEIRPDRGVR